MKLLKGMLSAAIICAIGLGVYFATTMPMVQERIGGVRRKGPTDFAVPVLAATAKRADMPVYLFGVGTAKARNSVVVRPQVDGRIMSINFKEGQEIKKGDLLAKLDPATYQAQLDQTLAKKAYDEVQIDNARHDLDRYSQLGGGVVAQKTIDTQRALVAQLIAQLKQDDAAIASAKAYLDYTTIVSPIDGRTGIRMVDEGNLVRAGDAGLVMITEVRPISVLFTLPQQQLAQVNTALMSKALSVDALDADNATLLDRGTLQVIDNQVDTSTGTIRMKAEFPNARLQLWPGQFVNVRLLINTLEQVVVVPTPAVQRGPNGTFVYAVQPEDKVVLHPVTLTMQNEKEAVVATGVNPGDRVVTTGFARLKDGARVNVGTPEDESGTPVASIKPEAKAGEARPGGRGAIGAACADDIRKLCTGVERQGIRSCLQTKMSELSETCKAAALSSGKGRRKADNSVIQ
ncbi:MAG: efflux RND transporter periplasmic adaptor subunit [Chloroflexota bacterium]